MRLFELISENKLSDRELDRRWYAQHPEEAPKEPETPAAPPPVPQNYNPAPPPPPTDRPSWIIKFPSGNAWTRHGVPIWFDNEATAIKKAENISAKRRVRTKVELYK